MPIEIRPATDAGRLRTFGQRYLSGFGVALPSDAAGNLLFPDLERALSAGGVTAWMIAAEGVDVGFALVSGRFIEDFFVDAAHRRQGAGRGAVRLLFASEAGEWSLSARDDNAAGLAFWRRVLAEYAIREEHRVDTLGVGRTFFFAQPFGGRS